MSPGLFRDGKDPNVYPEDASKPSHHTDIWHLHIHQSPSTWVKMNVASGYTPSITQIFSLPLAAAGQWRLCLDLSIVLCHADILGFACCSRSLICSCVCVNNTWEKDTWGPLCHNENTSTIAWWLIREFHPGNPNKQGKHCKNKTRAYQLALLHCRLPEMALTFISIAASLSQSPHPELLCRLLNAFSSALLFTELVAK